MIVLVGLAYIVVVVLAIVGLGSPVFFLLDIRKRHQPDGTFDGQSPALTVADVVIAWLKRL